MANKVYFGNAMPEEISVNINNALQGEVVQPRAVVDPDDKLAITLSATSVPTAANKGKGVFGNGGGGQNTNLITIIGGSLADAQSYNVDVGNSSGLDLYFYVFDGALVGQTQTGRVGDIKITPVE